MKPTIFVDKSAPFPNRFLATLEMTVPDPAQQGIFASPAHLTPHMPDLSQSPEPNSSPEITRIPHEAQSFEEIKNAVYERAAALWNAQKPFTRIRLGKNLYEILNRRLVFRTPAHKELPHFITPFGSLLVQTVHEDEIEHDAFVIE